MRNFKDTTPPPLGPLLMKLRVLNGLSLNQLAEAAGTSTSAIHRYESGWDRFELRTLRRLARALDAHLEIRLEPRHDDDEPDSLEDLSARLAPLFWDVDLTPRHLVDHPQWVLRRVLEFGDIRQNRWARRFFGDEAVATAARHRGMDPRVRRFWEVVLSAQQEES